MHSVWIIVGTLALAACPAPPAPRATPWRKPPPLGLPPVPVPTENPMTVEKVALGEKLFFDRRVASQPHSACADCHLPDHGYAGADPTQAFHRNVPTAWNRAYGQGEFWDGSAGRSLEDLVDGVVRFVNFDAQVSVGARLAAIADYRRDFQVAFGRPPDEKGVVDAIACYSRTLLAGDSPYDRFVAGDAKALSAEAGFGRTLFFGKAGCASCHSGFNFTDEQYHDIGIGQSEPLKRFYPPDRRGKPEFPELGRFNVTHRIADRGAFKTPTLRELASTGPYMHDGSFESLEAVIDYYDRGGLGPLGGLGVDPRLRPLGLSPEEKRGLAAFLRALSHVPPQR